LSNSITNYSKQKTAWQGGFLIIYLSEAVSFQSEEMNFKGTFGAPPARFPQGGMAERE